MDPIMFGLSSVEMRLSRNVFVAVRHFGVAGMASVKTFVGVDTFSLQTLSDKLYPKKEANQVLSRNQEAC
jgi:hypothetical protein